MPHYFLLRNDGTYSDLAEYSDVPPNRSGGQWVQGKPNKDILVYKPVSLNKKLEDLFMQLLPNHIGKNYMTDQIIDSIFKTKVSIIEANKIDPTGVFGKAIIRNLSLPEQMLADKTTILSAI